MSRLSGIDALRGIAAVLVMMQHVLGILAADGYGSARPILSTIDLGKFGVSLFFLISGFVIPFSFRHGLTGFAVSRAARLLPALWLSILFCLAFAPNLQSGMQLFANAFMLTHLLGEDTLNTTYWSLCWELYFYGIAAALFAYGRVQDPRIFGLLAMAFAGASFLDTKLTCLVFMVTGTLLRMVVLEKRVDAQRWLIAAIVALAGASCLWAIQEQSLVEFLSLILAVPAFLLLWNRLSHPALLWLGKVSFSLYLFHYPVVVLAGALGLHPLASALLGIGTSLLIAGAVYRFVEEPMIAAGKVTNRRLVKGSAVRTVSA